VKNISIHIQNEGDVYVSLALTLEEGDTLFSQDNVLLVHLFPSTLLSLAKNTQITLSESKIEEEGNQDKSFSVVNFIKGIVRFLVTKEPDQQIEQKVVADGVAFAVRGTEFEVSQDGENFDLDVLEGEVEVSSPHVQTFVPEVVKPNEGFRFIKRREEIRAQWKKKKLERREKRLSAIIKRRERALEARKSRRERKERKR
jgi:ferric-dicitrate binding protein FerR (iron transport regulator)